MNPFKKCRKNSDFDMTDIDNWTLTNVRATTKKKLAKESDSQQSVPVYFAILFCIYYALIFITVYFVEDNLPDYDPAEHRLNASNARDFMVRFVELGPKVVGSDANEKEVFLLLENEVKDIIRNKYENIEIEYERQLGSGSYYLAFEPYGSINTYSKVSNLIVKIKGQNPLISILINSHYDSVPVSPGGCDDGVMVASMLETLRVLSRGSTPTYNIIFLFNGAEESILQASHAFITQHPWREGVKVLINLEATGHGGKAMLFQTGPEQPWLLKYYAKVPYPHAQVAGEELFQANVIPSDTDFRIFRDFGDVIGYDLAFTKYGFRYHTRYDNADDLSVEVFQHTGANLLALVEAVMDAPEVADFDASSDEKPVFYDFLGWFLVHYNRAGEIAFNTVVILFAVAVYGFSIYDFQLYATNKRILYILLSLLGVLLGFVISVLFVLMIGAILDASGYSMRWYNSMWLVVGLYCAPVVGVNYLTALILNRYTRPDHFTLGMQTLFLVESTNVFWTIAFTVGFGLGIRSVYFFLYSILFTSLALAIIHAVRWHTSRHAWKIIYLICAIIPTLFTIQISLEVIGLFLPITGRSGADDNPEVTMSVLCGALTIAATCYFTPLIVGLKRPMLYVGAFVLVFVIFFIMAFTAMTFPYSAESKRPQRFVIWHTSRLIRGDNNEIVLNDAGYTFSNEDRNSPSTLEEEVEEIKYARKLGSDCDFALYCGIPTMNSRDLSDLREALWIQANFPEPNYPLVELSYDITLSSNAVQYKFTIKGPDRMSIMFSPRPGAYFMSTSLTDDHIESPTWKDGDRPTFYIVHTKGQTGEDLQFTVDFGLADNWGDNPVLDFAVAGKYIHDMIYSENYKNFLRQFPAWTNVQSYVGSYESWVLRTTKTI